MKSQLTQKLLQGSNDHVQSGFAQEDGVPHGDDKKIFRFWPQREPTDDGKNR